MKRCLNVSVLLLLVFLFSCNKKDDKTLTAVITNDNEKETEVIDIQSSDGFRPQYELKENGLYVFIDGPYRKKFIDKHSFEYIQKNYKYLRLESKNDKIQSGELTTKRQKCKIQKSSVSNLGKPSLYELGYERHKEREIKPEDNRFGKEVKKTNTWYEYVVRVAEDIHYNSIDASEFIQLSTKEFIKNGIVILGDNISRVVIKKLSPLPKWGNKILVYYEKNKYNCAGDIMKHTILEPEIIADFKRINFRENIFEFIKEEPLPDNADYLSDFEYMKLTANIQQFIPRNRQDRTIHKKHTFHPGYYIIEYYEKNRLQGNYCIKLGAKGKRPNLWEPLNFSAPNAYSSNTGDLKYIVKVKEFQSLLPAKEYIKEKSDYGFNIFKVKSGGYIVGIKFLNNKDAIAQKASLYDKGMKSVSIINVK